MALTLLLDSAEIRNPIPPSILGYLQALQRAPARSLSPTMGAIRMPVTTCAAIGIALKGLCHKPSTRKLRGSQQCAAHFLGSLVRLTQATQPTKFRSACPHI